LHQLPAQSTTALLGIDHQIEDIHHLPLSPGQPDRLASERDGGGWSLVAIDDQHLTVAVETATLPEVVAVVVEAEP
jgi:hypothetical protein